MNFEDVASYVQTRQTSDGGFFFARVPPGTATDTYYALKTLSLIGSEAADRDAVRSWVLEAGAESYLDSPRRTFHLVSAAELLKIPIESRRAWARRVELHENSEGGYGTCANFDREVTSELESTFYAVSALVSVGLPIDAERITDFVMAHRNLDGGFGRAGVSTLPSTYLAVATLVDLASPGELVEPALAWLRHDYATQPIAYLEDAFWLAGALRRLRAPVPEHDALARFVRACQASCGGFSRAVFGIATLESTYQAVQLLGWLELS